MKFVNHYSSFVVLCLLLFSSCIESPPDDDKVQDLQTKSYAKFQELNYADSITIDPERIRPYDENPRYWQYKGEPVLLLGASDEDNLFNHPDIWPYGLESHLDLMVHNGGNYVRNTMSSRDHGNVWPFGKNEEGLYDLTTWNEEYWSRFENFLEMTYERDIIVQIELWDRFDFAREPWSENPFNQKNNVNYNTEESGLPEVIDSHPGQRENPFFRTPTEFENNPLVLNYQEKLINKIISYTFDYPHILYCISNETNESPKWSDYWALFLKETALDQDVLIHVTEMWDSWDLSDPEHNATFGKPDLYTFVDISQNNHQTGQTHWDNAQKFISESLDSHPRPVNSVKIYGGLQHGGGFEEGARKLWRNIFGGFASSRFHRSSNYFEPSGIGLTPLAQNQINSMRMLIEELNIYANQPANHLISDREDDEAYAIAESGESYAVYLPNGGSVSIDLSNLSGNKSMKWLDIMHSEWGEELLVSGGENMQLNAPNDNPWVVLFY